MQFLDVEVDNKEMTLSQREPQFGQEEQWVEKWHQRISFFKLNKKDISKTKQKNVGL